MMAQLVSADCAVERDKKKLMVDFPFGLSQYRGG